MEKKITPSELELNEFIKIINEMSGIDLTDKKNILALKLNKFLEGTNTKNFSEFLGKLKSNRQLKQETLDFVTIGETYFLRELAQLKEIILLCQKLRKESKYPKRPLFKWRRSIFFGIIGCTEFY